MNALEPDSDMRNERNAGVQLRTNLPLVNMIRQAVRDDVVGQELHVVLWARLSASAGIPGDTEGSGLPTEERDEGSNANLGSGGIASGVGNAGAWQSRSG